LGECIQVSNDFQGYLEKIGSIIGKLAATRLKGGHKKGNYKKRQGNKEKYGRIVMGSKENNTDFEDV
jgi:hypothetical protein